MSNDTRNYYERELDLIDLNGKHPAKILIGSEGKTTRTLDINKESAAALIHRLTAFLLTPEPKEESADTHDTRLGYVASNSLDKNGNSIVRVSSKGKSFTVQTNGVLPRIHREGVTALNSVELETYISRHGTPRQRRILGVLP